MAHARMSETIQADRMMNQDNENVLRYNKEYLQVVNLFFNAMREDSHEQLCEALIKWKTINTNALNEGFHFWAGQAQANFIGHLEQAVSQKAHRGNYFAQQAIMEHGVVTPYMLNRFLCDSVDRIEDKIKLVANMIENKSYFMPSDPHQYIQGMGSALYQLVRHGNLDLASKLYEKIIPGIGSWYEFRRLVIQTMGYRKDNISECNIPEIISKNAEYIKSLQPDQSNLDNDDPYTAKEILFLLRNNFFDIAENCAKFMNNANWFLDLVEIDAIRPDLIDQNILKELVRKVPDSTLGYLIVTGSEFRGPTELINFSEADFAKALSQFHQSGVTPDLGATSSLIVERFNNQYEYDRLCEMATRLGVQDHPALMAVSGYKRSRLGNDLSI